MAHHRGCSDEVLEAVEHEQHAQAAQAGDQALDRVDPRGLDEAEGADDLGHDERRVVDVGQADERPSVAERRCGAAGDLDGEARLAAASRADDGDDAAVRAAQQVGELGQLGVAPEQTGSWIGDCLGVHDALAA